MGFYDDCDADERFLAWESQHSDDPPSSIWQKYDFDQRRCITVAIKGQQDPDGHVADEFLAKHINDIPRDAVQVGISKDGALISSSADEDLDQTRLPIYPPITAIPEEFQSRVVNLATLVEVERLGAIVDLVIDKTSLRKYVFKWHIHWKEFIGLWHEMNCMMRLSSHPNVVSLDRLVIAKCGPDEQDRIVGFTMEHVAGGTFEKNKSRVFKMKYLKQLISVVDHLNLRLGIIHQDIVPDNLLLDAVTDTIKLFDFNFSARVGSKGYEDNFHLFRDRKNRDDVKGVVFLIYEIVTGDWQYNSKPLSTFPMADVLREPWVQREQVQLDSSLEAYQSALRDWVAIRKAPENIVSHYTELTDHILEWPALEGMTVVPDDVKDSSASGEARFYRLRRDARRCGELYLRWERPAHDDIPRDNWVLANGELVSDNQLDAQTINGRLAYS